MRTNNTITFKLSRFYALEKVDLTIKGITLLNGPHQTGKDKLLSFIHDTIRFPLLFESYKTDQFWQTLEDMYNHLVFLCYLINPLCHKDKYFPPFKTIQSMENEKEWIDIIDQLEMLYRELYLQEDNTGHNPKDIYPNDYSKDHFMHMLELKEDPVTYPVSDLFKTARRFIHTHFANAEKNIHTRSGETFINYLNEKHAPIQSPIHFELYEGNSLIVSSDIREFGYFKSLGNVLYIDAPRFFGTRESWYIRNWDYIYEAFLKAHEQDNSSCELTERLKKLIDGDIIQHIPNHIYDKYEPVIKKIEFTDYPEKWFKFRAKDGTLMPLSECSFDISKFILLERLLVNRVIDNQTLIIYNDPENHLTPEQMEEFAWMVARLTAKHKVRFLFSSYNPDMGKILTKVCEEQGISEELTIYNAQKGTEDYRYSFY